MESHGASHRITQKRATSFPEVAPIYSSGSKVGTTTGQARGGGDYSSRMFGFQSATEKKEQQRRADRHDNGLNETSFRQ